MMLLIATQSPFTKALPPSVNDVTVVLTQDSVIAATLPDSLAQFNEVFVLESDLHARGLQVLNSQAFKLIDLEKFVELTALHHPIVNW
ncbi:DsrH/TusB family sulfur relay protein [Psychrobium sp. 1_MG-2023]|uniref:DsrH/TusB family sulfur relay protein n=1 Tax=Psychrobium sp. 1_MG-2023 TaxID=3062624 RepID=UPI000C346922|nr:DsrH/TusB family sulfur metabolism protein [Psychrobium sp. 1_MG-2023]MDP2562977.1 DsrH/TusB family sulfur metabolism protein [Psychrobium sp. 1_MG-2023]PKF59723.1 hypothetical protein CW748_00530 [Alteromonadales bacterium alter-6D02]